MPPTISPKRFSFNTLLPTNKLEEEEKTFESQNNSPPLNNEDPFLDNHEFPTKNTYIVWKLGYFDENKLTSAISSVVNTKEIGEIQVWY